MKWILTGIVVAVLAIVGAFFAMSGQGDVDDSKPNPHPVRIVAAMERTVFQSDPTTDTAQAEALRSTLQQCVDATVECTVSSVFGAGDANAAVEIGEDTRIVGKIESDIHSESAWEIHREQIERQRRAAIDHYLDTVLQATESTPLSRGCTNVFGTVRTALDKLNDGDTTDGVGKVDKQLVLMASGNSNCPPIVLISPDGQIASSAQVEAAAEQYAPQGSAGGASLAFVGFGATYLKENRLPSIEEREQLNLIWKQLADFWGFRLEAEPIDGGR